MLLPPASDVVAGIPVDNTVGLCNVPMTSQVLAGVAVGEAFGTLAQSAIITPEPNELSSFAAIRPRGNPLQVPALEPALI